MKLFKYLMTVMVLMLVIASASAQPTWAIHNSSKVAPGGIPANRFLAVPAVYATNTLQITNLATAGSVGTNIVGTVFTNKNNSRVVVTTAGAYSPIPLLQDVSLAALQDGAGAWVQSPTNGSQLYNASYATLATTMTAQSGANAPVTFVFTPLFNGVNEASEAADLWTFSFTPTASSTQTFTTNAPLWRWPGAAKLRLKRIVNGDTDATSAVIITDVSLNQFGPP
jgi:hypothetical protein